MCQRNHGAAFITWFAIGRRQLTIRAGDDQLNRYASSTHGNRSFCRSCGTSLFCENDKHPDQVDIPLANMEAAIDRIPEFHCYFDSKASWVEIGDDLPRLGGESGLEPLKDEETAPS
jgi:hypothetical protein